MLEYAPRDTMTNFFSREALAPFLDKIVRAARINPRKFCIAVFDLDHLKAVNDKYGHFYGDDVLKEVTGALRSVLEDKGLIFRYGGDEFVTIFLDKDSKDIMYLARQCRLAVARHIFKFGRKNLKLTISCGIADFPKDTDDADELMKKADQAMYFSKRFGGNLITKFSRIKYINFRNNILRLIAILAVVFSIFAVNKFVFKDFIQNTIWHFRTLRIVKNKDTVVLKNGSIVRGKILEEMESSILVSLEMEDGKAEITLEKSEIIRAR